MSIEFWIWVVGAVLTYLVLSIRMAYEQSDPVQGVILPVAMGLVWPGIIGVFLLYALFSIPFFIASWFFDE